MNILNIERKIFSKRFLIVLICIFLIVAGILLLRSINEIPHWQDLEISSIHLEGINAEFALKDGKIYKNGKEISQWRNKSEYNRALRLAFFYQWMKEDPIMFASDIDSDTVGASLEKMKLEEAKLAEEVQKHQGGSDLVNKSQFQLFPAAFLSNFLNSSKEYEKFSKEISERNAKVLLGSIKDTNLAYENDARQIGSGFSRAVGDNDKQNFAYMLGETVSTPGIIKSDFVKISENGKLLESEIQKRADCLEKGLHFCIRPTGDYSQPVGLNTEDDAVPDLLTAQQVGITNQENEYRGPYKLNSQCWGGRNQSYVYYATRCRTRVGCMEYSYLANDAYFEKINPNDHQWDVLTNQGAELLPQPTTGPYGCNNLEYKQDLSTLDYFYENYKDNRVFQEMFLHYDAQKLGSAQKIIEDGVKLENEFFDARYPSEDALDRLTQQYGVAYEFLSKNNLLEFDTRQQLLKVHLLLIEKFVNIDYTINRSLFHLQSYVNQIEKSGKLVPLPYIYSARSNYSLLFLDFSSAVWRSLAKLEYLKNNINKKELLNPSTASELNYSQARQLYGDDRLDVWRKLFAIYKADSYMNKK